MLVGFAAAMVAAPFLTLFYGLELALVVLIAVLLATAFLAFDAARAPIVAAEVRRRMLGAVTLNFVLALLAGVLLLVRMR